MYTHTHTHTHTHPQDGEIVERGTHDHLLVQDGVYASMWNQQQQSLELNGIDELMQGRQLGESKM